MNHWHAILKALQLLTPPAKLGVKLFRIKKSSSYHVSWRVIQVVKILQNGIYSFYLRKILFKNWQLPVYVCIACPIDYTFGIQAFSTVQYIPSSSLIFLTFFCRPFYRHQYSLIYPCSGAGGNVHACICESAIKLCYIVNRREGCI